MPKYHPIDVRIGMRLKERRRLLGLSQTTIGMAIGVTYQLVQKYEKGATRIYSSRLYEIAQFLAVPIEYFFPEGAETDRADSAHQLSIEAQVPDAEHFRSETLKLVRGYYCIKNEKTRAHLLRVVLTLANASRKDEKSSSK